MVYSPSKILSRKFDEILLELRLCPSLLFDAVSSAKIHPLSWRRLSMTRFITDVRSSIDVLWRSTFLSFLCSCRRKRCRCWQMSSHVIGNCFSDFAISGFDRRTGRWLADFAIAEVGGGRGGGGGGLRTNGTDKLLRYVKGLRGCVSSSSSSSASSCLYDLSETPLSERFFRLCLEDDSPSSAFQLSGNESRFKIVKISWQLGRHLGFWCQHWAISSFRKVFDSVGFFKWSGNSGRSLLLTALQTWKNQDKKFVILVNLSDKN